jgi:hypothetical protein
MEYKSLSSQDNNITSIVNNEDIYGFIDKGSHNIFNIRMKEKYKVPDENIFLSFIIYFIVFVITVPYFLFTNKMYNILEVYLPNLDLVANLVSYRGGLFKGEFFGGLYKPVPTSVSEFLSQSAVNYLALLGVTYIIAREAKLSNNIAYGWSAGFIMIMLTYLLPSQFISRGMDIVYDKFHSIFYKDKEKKGILLNYIPALVIGIIMTISIIGIERIIIIKNRDLLKNTAKYLMNIPKIIN